MRTPEKILERAREMIRQYAGADPDKWFYANRYVFARLQLDERKTKTKIKNSLIDRGQPCHYCGKQFNSSVGIHLHRIDDARGYSADNCVLMHAECHRAHHSEHQSKTGVTRKRSAKRRSGARPVLVKRSKRYERMAFLYWWDITPGNTRDLLELAKFEAVQFVKKDTQQRCRVPVQALKGFLTPERQTTRSQGNWGIKVFREQEDNLAFEPGRSGDDWLFLPVVWLGKPEH